LLARLLKKKFESISENSGVRCAMEMMFQRSNILDESIYRETGQFYFAPEFCLAKKTSAFIKGREPGPGNTGQAGKKQEVSTSRGG
jgi:hypothetical protein